MMPEREPAVLDDPIAPGIVRHSFESLLDGKKASYLVKDFRAPATRRCPLAVVYLHGAASHESQGMTRGLYGNAFGKWANEFAARQAIYLCPEYRGGSWMGPAAESDLLEIFHWLHRQHAPEKVILLGASMGGTSALIFAARHAEQLDGVIALCPASDMVEMYPSFSNPFRIAYGGSPDEVPEEYAARSVRIAPGNLAMLPLVIVHGSDDKIIPVHHSRQLVQQISAKTRLRYLEIPGGNHDAPLFEPLPPLLDFILHENPG